MKKFEIIINKQIFLCQLSLKSRKNINITIKPGNKIYVSKPKSVSTTYIKNYLITNSSWIIEKSKSINALASKRQSYISNEYVVIFDEKLFFNKLNLNKHRQSNTSELNDYLDKQLLAYVMSVREPLDAIMNEKKLKLPTLKIKKMKNKWGSCYVNDNVIYINQKLVHYPKLCIDYVLLHEYVHFIYPNHSKDFYKLINYYMPNYRDAVKYLKSN